MLNATEHMPLQFKGGRPGRLPKSTLCSFHVPCGCENQPGKVSGDWSILLLATISITLVLELSNLTRTVSDFPLQSLGSQYTNTTSALAAASTGVAGPRFTAM